MKLADFNRAARLTVSLAGYELLTQRRESFLGLVWPLLQAGGLLLAFNLFRGDTGGLALILSTYLGVLVWTTASTVLISNLRILPANRELITHIAFPHAILSVVDVSVKYLFFAVQVLAGVAVWLAVVPNEHWLLVLAYLPIYLLAFYLALLAMAWMASIIGAALPDLSFLLPPVLLLLLALSPVFQRTNEAAPGVVRIFNEINPFSLWVDAFYATIGVARAGPTAPFVFLAAALAAVALARVLVAACYREITKVV